MSDKKTSSIFIEHMILCVKLISMLSFTQTKDT